MDASPVTNLLLIKEFFSLVELSEDEDGKEILLLKDENFDYARALFIEIKEGLKMEEKLYTEKELNEALQKLQKEFEKDIAVIMYIKTDNYYINNLVTDEEVKKCRNILAVSHLLSPFIEAISVIGFERFNDEIMKIIDKQEKETEEDTQ